MQKPKKATKTAWAHKVWIIWACAVLIDALLIIYFAVTSMPTLKVGNNTIKLLTTPTSAAQTKGLGYRKSLPQNEGMLFVFNTPAVQCFWMKGMEFPLDIIWVSDQKVVQYIGYNFQPDSYPKPYCPPYLTQYVVEVNAGIAIRDGIKVNEQLSF